MDRSLTRRLSAEGIGTFWLVLGGCGTAVLAGDNVQYLGVALAFGLTVLTMAYAFGHISGGHFNPAVTLGHVLAKRFPAKDAAPYMAAQVVGAIAAAVTELVLTFGFLLVILGVTDTRAHPALAGLGIGLALTLIHLISIPVTNTSVNPARSIGPALFVGGTWLRQLWFFILVPLIGGGLAGLAYPRMFGDAPGDTSAA